MSRGTKLQEMDVKTQQSKTAVNSGAKPADAMDSSVAASYEDLGGPTPENYKPDDDSAKLKEPGGTLKQVKDVVNKGAKPAEAAKGMKEEEVLDTEETIEEEETSTEDVVAEEEIVAEYDVEEDVNALLGGEELSEEFKEKAKTIFEAAINAKAAGIREELEQAYAAQLSEEIEEAKVGLGERVDSYLEYVADEWFTENALVIEQALKTEMTESFLTGMKSLFEEHYVEIPEEKYDVLESMVDKLDDMETKLNEQIEKNVSLNGRLGESVASGILDQVSGGLAATQKEKLASLAESVEFESEDQYRGKLETLRESYFQGVSPKAAGETISETVDHSQGDVSGSMAGYLKTLHAVAKK